MFLTPTIRVDGVTGFRLEEIYLLFFLSVLIFVSIKENKGRLLIPSRVVLLVGFSFLIVLSISVGSFLKLPASILDLSKFIWLFKAMVVYLVFYNYVNLSDKNKQFRIDYILKLFVFFGFVSSVICIQQYFDLFNLNSFYVPFVAPTQFYTLMPGYDHAPRVVGMLGNPNVQGYVLALSLICYSMLSLNGRKKFRIYMFVSMLLALILTLSRTSFIVYIIGLFILVLLYKKDSLFDMYKVILLALVISSLIGLYLLFKDNELVYKLVIFRFERLEQGLDDVSFTARLEQWRLNVEYFQSSPIFGVGPLPRSNIFGSADNEWLLFLRSYGIVGVCWLLLFMFYPVLLIRPKNKQHKNRKAFIFSILAASCLYMVPAAIITSTLVFPFLLALLATHDYTIFVLSGKASTKILV